MVLREIHYPQAKHDMENPNHHPMPQQAHEEIHEFIRRKGKMVIIGLGNEWKGDDGAGLLAVRMLKEVVEDENVLVLEAGRTLLNFLPEIEKMKPSGLLFIDSAELGSEAGTVMTVKESQIVERGISTHENNLGLALSYLRKKDPALEVLFIGIQFASMEMTETLTLSPKVKEGVERVVDLIVGSTD